MEDKDIKIGEKYLFIGYTEESCGEKLNPDDILFNELHANKIVEVQGSYGPEWIVSFDDDKEIIVSVRELKPIKG